MCSDKPNTRPWGDPEDAEETDDEAILALLYGKYPRMQEDMELYANIMAWGASFSIAIVTVLHGLCPIFIQLHIRTPLWVWRVAFVGLCFFAGFAATATFMWLVASLL